MPSAISLQRADSPRAAESLARPQVKQVRAQSPPAQALATPLRPAMRQVPLWQVPLWQVPLWQVPLWQQRPPPAVQVKRQMRLPAARPDRLAPG